MKIGIAGGIGSGKSYVCQLLKARGISVYDCDAAAKRLMTDSPELRRQLTDLIGQDCYLQEAPGNPNNQGTPESPKAPQSPGTPESPEPPRYRLNKPVIARFLLSSEANGHAIDAIVHPAVFRDFEASGMEWMESAIMYESGIYRLVDRVVVVTAPEEVRIQRIMARDGITREKAIEWMHRQWPQERVRQQADYEIVNDGGSDLNRKIDRLLRDIDGQDCRRQATSHQEPDNNNK